LHDLAYIASFQSYARGSKLKLTKSQTKTETTRSTGTVHTSAKAHLNGFAIGIRIRDLDRHQNVTICSSAHCQPSLKISCKSVQKFYAKLLTERQTDKQTDSQRNNDDYISSLAEVTTNEHSTRPVNKGCFLLRSKPIVELYLHCRCRRSFGTFHGRYTTADLDRFETRYTQGSRALRPTSHRSLMNFRCRPCH